MYHIPFSDLKVQIALAAVVVSVIALTVFFRAWQRVGTRSTSLSAFEAYTKFCWNCFFQPHTIKTNHGQQDALESFYKAQASIYDATRVRLLRGREDMLGLVAAQVKRRVINQDLPRKSVWIDVGGGTGYNIEQMGRFVDVPNFFEAVYLVDLSPSLCSVAEDRFARLGWKNVHVLCQDARNFRIGCQDKAYDPFVSDRNTNEQEAHLITLSYSLSMMPDYYSVVDALSARLSENGVIGVADFYVQSEIDYQSRNYLGGEINRHCVWISRVFWRTWFEVDRVSLEAGRRVLETLLARGHASVDVADGQIMLDYLEYRFGTVLSLNERCHLLGLRIPYYVWIGCCKNSNTSRRELAELNAAATESPYLSAINARDRPIGNSAEVRSKAYESAIINLSACLPLPPSWYQAHHWRIYYDETLRKHRQFYDEYIYAFTWEDARVDARILKLDDEDVVLAITSAGDNILAYALDGPKRIHAVDLNPSQNHLLELKLAAFAALPYEDVWALFGRGKHPNFRQLLLSKLSPHLSSLAFQHWFHHGPGTFSPSGKGFYYTGGSRHALNLVAWLFRILGIRGEVTRLCAAPTLAEQREIWKRSIRRVVLSRLLAWCVVSNKKWLWKTLGVPNAQREMIERDFAAAEAAGTSPQPGVSPFLAASQQSPSGTPVSTSRLQCNDSLTQAHNQPDTHNYGTGRAIWAYAVATLDPVINTTLLSSSNHYYLVCLLGRYVRTCCPDYLTPRAYAKLSKPKAFDGLRIHTDELVEVVERMAPGTLTVAVLMDSMDWFEAPSSDSNRTDEQDRQNGATALRRQIQLLRAAMKVDGRVLLRSAGQMPWYIRLFEEEGFKSKRVNVRTAGACVDRVNMYASTWLCTKLADRGDGGKLGAGGSRKELEPLSLGQAGMVD